ncbi:N-acetyl-gamma-glutamyl-phosphate reductase [Acetobacterium paludosum]|uniref:N-acetyl-gamma-glutamyl-phosphate reductase n=1 Tax=Acetobacterium paludosum TaxID=52693 RepID=A0A923HWX1_9FIRM|nr:N-acetyl-gamma-glutamyl-phosphate reductase [Acetobacterium paludosum]MBC3889097.1 N-acetyl-gamma-glutamyl-phosphate reductase [Acetobacterium paludosum]
MIKASVIGGTGYAGQELIRILMRHPEVEIVTVGSRSYAGQKFSDIYGNYENIMNHVCEVADIKELAEKSDVVFLALPHGIASKMVTEEILMQTKIIDLGADFRLKDIDIYEDWYNTEHHNKSLLKEAVYGLCELHRDDIRDARLIANPGCYTTCSILSLAPLVKNDLIDINSIIIDAKSGVTGAGRGMVQTSMYSECNESIKAYKIGEHRHTPEIEQELGLFNGKNFNLLFTPHLVPMNRGILALSYATLTKSIAINELQELYKDFYKDEYFVRLTGDRMPETRWVKGSNYCDIGLKIDTRTNHVVIVGAIDNLIKGAAGQAVQNMNIVFDLDEKTGIDFIADFPI